jgi:hypothetical protein
VRGVYRKKIKLMYKHENMENRLSPKIHSTIPVAKI